MRKEINKLVEIATQTDTQLTVQKSVMKDYDPCAKTTTITPVVAITLTEDIGLDTDGTLIAVLDYQQAQMLIKQLQRIISNM